MIGKPLSDYQIVVDSPKRMKEDGSIPGDLLAQYLEEKRLAAEEAEASEKAEVSKDMDALWEAIKRLENENKELQKKLSEKADE